MFCSQFDTNFVILPQSHGLSTLKKVLEDFSPSASYVILAPSLAPFACLFSN